MDGDQYRESGMIPSLVGVEGIEGGKPVYCFGYEAKQLAGKTYPDEDCPVFYDIKRWISAPERTQEVVARRELKSGWSERVCWRHLCTI